MNDKTLGQIAFETFAWVLYNIENEEDDGLPTVLREWKDIQNSVREGWEAAANVVYGLAAQAFTDGPDIAGEKIVPGQLIVRRDGLLYAYRAKQDAQESVLGVAANSADPGGVIRYEEHVKIRKAK